MSPKLALLVFTSFIGVILVIEARQQLNTSMALWIPLLWFIITASKPLAYWLNPHLVYTDVMDFAPGAGYFQLFYNEVYYDENVLNDYPVDVRETVHEYIADKGTPLPDGFEYSDLDLVDIHFAKTNFSRIVKKPYAVYHLGEAQVNWSGRQTQRWDD